MLAAVTTSSPPMFGSFALLAKLATGDIGDLFLARSQGAGGFEKLVIIKRLRPELMKSPDISKIFLTEACSAGQLEHPNVRIIYEIGRNNDDYYLVLEYLEGVPFVDVLLGREAQPQLADTRLIASLLAQTSHGLHAAHTLKTGSLVHGDVNPRSIFITASGTVKVLDFDVVEMRGALAKSHGFVRRTNAYISPEEIRTGVCEKLGDVFSLGVVAWEAITGRRLFKQPTREETFAAILHGKVPDAKEFRPDISDALNSTVMRALQQDPSLRFQSAEGFGVALERAALAEGPPLTPLRIAEIIESTFSDTLQKQQEFVRSARNGPVTASTDWEQSDDATKVVGFQRAMELSAEQSDDKGALQAENPFQEVAQSVDYSGTEAPNWQETRNWVVAEISAELEENTEETGVVDMTLVGPISDFMGDEATRISAPPLAAISQEIAPPPPPPQFQEPQYAPIVTSTVQVLPQKQRKRTKLKTWLLASLVAVLFTIVIVMLYKGDAPKIASSEQLEIAVSQPVAAESEKTDSKAATAILAAAKQTDAGHEAKLPDTKPADAEAPMPVPESEQPQRATPPATSAAQLAKARAEKAKQAAEAREQALKEIRAAELAKINEAKERQAKERARKDRSRKLKAEKQRKIQAVRLANQPPGYLTISAIPYATVFINGDKKGITPLVKLKLSAGTHRVKLVNSEGETQMLKVKIISDDVVRRKVTF